MRTADGMELTAPSDDPAAVVRELRAASHRPGRSVAEFMALAASRAAAQSGKPVRSDGAANFVADLLRAGLLLEDDKPEETL